jgi:hypothetical protein
MAEQRPPERAGLRGAEIGPVQAGDERDVPERADPRPDQSAGKPPVGMHDRWLERAARTNGAGELGAEELQRRDPGAP